MHRLTCPRTYYKGSNMRGDWIISEGDSLLILKHLSEGQGPVGTFFGDGDAGESTLPLPC